MIDLYHVDCIEYMADQPDNALVSDLNEGGFSMREIADRTGVHYSTVSRMLKNGYKSHKTNARYMSDLSRDMEWFYHV